MSKLPGRAVSTYVDINTNERPHWTRIIQTERAQAESQSHKSGDGTLVWEQLGANMPGAKILSLASTRTRPIWAL